MKWLMRGRGSGFELGIWEEHGGVCFCCSGAGFENEVFQVTIEKEDVDLKSGVCHKVVESVGMW